jgi:hypothetical protein
MPSRQIKPNSRSCTGSYVTRDGEALQFESQLERDVLVTLDFDPTVREISVQPFQIEGYHPDCEFTRFAQRWICEIKYESELVMKWRDLLCKYSKAHEYCVSKGLMFGFITDASVYFPERHRVSLLKQIRFLGNGNDFDEQVQEQLANKLVKSGPILISSLARQIEAPLSPARRVREICRLICSGVACVLKTQTLNLADCVISRAVSDESLAARTSIIGFEEMTERIQTHPFQHLQDGSARIVA